MEDNIQYKIDLQKFVSGDYEHTVLTKRWLTKNTNMQLYDDITNHNGLIDMLYWNKTDDTIYCITEYHAKRFIKLIACLIHQKYTYAKILKINTVRHTKTIGECIRLSEYSEYGLESLKQ